MIHIHAQVCAERRVRAGGAKRVLQILRILRGIRWLQSSCCRHRRCWNGGFPSQLSRGHLPDRRSSLKSCFSRPASIRYQVSAHIWRIPKLFIGATFGLQYHIFPNCWWNVEVLKKGGERTILLSPTATTTWLLAHFLTIGAVERTPAETEMSMFWMTRTPQEAFKSCMQTFSNRANFFTPIFYCTTLNIRDQLNSSSLIFWSQYNTGEPEMEVNKSMPWYGVNVL